MPTPNYEKIWNRLRDEVTGQQIKEPLLADFFQQNVLQHATLEAAIQFIVADKLQSPMISGNELLTIFSRVLSSPANTSSGAFSNNITRDLHAIYERDCACKHYYQALCFFKGFHALATYRIMHALWLDNQKQTALFLQSRMSAVFDVDIHPAAQIGGGVMLDHATGIVIGETACVGNDVSIMQAVTLGGTGKESGDRHPKIGNGVLISVGAIILGNISVGDGAQIAAGSVVLDPVPAHTLVAGIPAQMVGKPDSQKPALKMNHCI